MPCPDATGFPVRSTTATVQPSVEERRAWNRTRTAHGAGDRGAVQLRQPGGRNPPRERGQESVRDGAGALAGARVAVAGDSAKRHELAGMELEVPAGGVEDLRQRVDVRDVEAPREQPHQRGSLRLRRSGGGEVADERDSDRAGVESLRVRPDHVLVDAAAAAFVDRPEAVDEEVVADVVPAVALNVVDLDPAHDRRRLRARIAIRAGGVMHDGQAQHRRDHGSRADDLLVRIPAGTTDDRRLAGRGDGTRRCRQHP